MNSMKSLIFLIIHFIAMSFCRLPLRGTYDDLVMNMNIMKMLDRFYTVRYSDSFFRRNIPQQIYDNYLNDVLQIEVTDTLKKDIQTQISYFENTVNEKDDELSTTCYKLTRYLLNFSKIGLSNIITRIQQFLRTLLLDENPKAMEPYEEVFRLLISYIYALSIKLNSEYNNKELCKNNPQECLRKLKKLEFDHSYILKLRIENFFRIIHFGSDIKSADVLNENLKDEKEEEDKKNLNQIDKETIKVWKVSKSLLDMISNHDPDQTEMYFDESSKLRIYRSTGTILLRELEIQKLKTQGIDKTNEPIFRFGNRSIVHEILIDTLNAYGTQIRLVPIKNREIINPLETFDSLERIVSKRNLSEDFASAIDESFTKSVPLESSGVFYKQKRNQSASVEDISNVLVDKTNIKENNEPLMKATVKPTAIQTKSHEIRRDENKSPEEKYTLPVIEEMNIDKTDIEEKKEPSLETTVKPITIQIDSNEVRNGDSKLPEEKHTLPVIEKMNNSEVEEKENDWDRMPTSWFPKREENSNIFKNSSQDKSLKVSPILISNLLNSLNEVSNSRSVSNYSKNVSDFSRKIMPISISAH